MDINIVKTKNSVLIPQILTYLIAIIMIIDCNSIFITGIYSNLINRLNLIFMVIAVLSLMYIYRLQNADLSNFVVIISCLLIYVILYFVFPKNYMLFKDGFIGLIKFILMFSLAYLVYRTTYYPYLFEAYCNMVVIVAVVSLFFWVVGSNWHLINPTGVYISNWSANGTKLPSYYNLYFESQRIGDSVRNSAIFAEAPMASLTFSIALSLETLCLKYDKFHILKIVILSLAIISTLSTTGYICLILILGYKVIVKRYLNDYVNILKFIIIPLILIVSIIEIQRFLTQKFDTHSGLSRSQDYINCFKVWGQYPFLGAGIGAGQKNLIIKGIKIGNFGYSNSFGKILGENGLYIFSLYFISILRSIYLGIKNNNFNRLFLTAILIYLFVTTMWVNTYTMLFLFSFIAIWQPNS